MSRRDESSQLSGSAWRTSSHSGGHNECVQVADAHPEFLPVRDSKFPEGPTLAFPRVAWTAFVAHLR
ncbi:DUF397 domain-containing protein [Streptomyces sulphureus]|uniref:DUF397 domain-containing protein n=1 Tax=Streptomyces sulphureus TaxID=47758 RepID=UPI0003657FB8|nr:DUF397 domain-containing protein [Streptomyces sulphureus]